MDIFETIEAWSGFILILACVSIFFTSVSIWVGAKMVKVRDLNFRRAMKTAAMVTFVVSAITIMFSAFPNLHILVGLICGFISTTFVIKNKLKTNIKLTSLFWILITVSQILALMATSYLFIGGIEDLIKII